MSTTSVPNTDIDWARAPEKMIGKRALADATAALDRRATFPQDVLFTLANGPDPANINWRTEYATLYGLLQALQAKFADDIPALCQALTELTGDSVAYDYWDHTPAYAGGNHTCEHVLYAVVNKTHYRGNTLAQAEAKLRADFIILHVAEAATEEEVPSVS